MAWMKEFNLMSPSQTLEMKDLISIGPLIVHLN